MPCGHSGGNAAFSQGLVDKLRRDLGRDAVHSSLRVLDIRRVDDGVRVTYLGTDDKLHTVLAGIYIVATPKFIAKKLIGDLPAEQLEAMGKLRYRAYIVGHVLIEQPRAPDFHDPYCIAGHAPEGSLKDGTVFLMAFEGLSDWDFEWGGSNSEVQLWRVVFGTRLGMTAEQAALYDGTTCDDFVCLVRAGTEDDKDSYKNMHPVEINGNMFRYGGGAYIAPSSNPNLEKILVYGTEHYIQKSPQAFLWNEF